MRFGSLFTGIGGIDLGLERAGMSCAWQVERDPYCRKVLARHWPDVPCFDDVTAFPTEEVEPVDLICGGFPCQPVSQAGKRKGKNDDRWLWPEFARVLGVLRPRYALLENVPGLLTADGGRLFGGILADLAALGFDAQWQSVPAAAVGAPHLRWRVFIMADASSPRRREDPRGAFGDEGADAGRSAKKNYDLDGHGQGDRTRHLADAASERAQGDGSIEAANSRGSSDRRSSRSGQAIPDADEERRRGGSGVLGTRGRGESSDTGQAIPDSVRDERRTRAAGGGVPEGSSAWWATEPDVGRVAYGVPSRVDRLRALGNAVVPQVAEVVGRAIMASDQGAA